jgi:protoporphyrinogen/coproporphyrinogen III oxidase
MKRIAIIGGGISGLTAAYELEKQRKAGADIDWTLYEASARLGGIIETTRRDGFILEGGPDGWVSEKPWARELAIELGLESQLIYSNDATRKTYILIDGKLQPMPDRMRMMVPEDLATLKGSTLFSATAREAYANELRRADELRSVAPAADESVASFVRRHFGNEVLAKIGAPLLSGVFGGDVEKLSVRAVMPAFVAMEREHGSLIAAIQPRSKSDAAKPIFTSLRNGMGSLVEALIAHLPPERVRFRTPVQELAYDEEWNIWFGAWDTLSLRQRLKAAPYFDEVVLATPLHVTRRLLAELDPVETTLLPSSVGALSLLPTDASSAILVTFAWLAETAASFTIPPGFGFLVPQSSNAYPPQTVISTEAKRSGEIAALNTVGAPTEPFLLACTFVDQKFPNRTPENARLIRVFFGNNSDETFANKSGDEIAAIALTQLEKILGRLPAPDPTLTNVCRWPRSLPQYEVGHLERIAALDARIATLGGLTLLGNSYRGVGLPDLIRDARTAARALTP